MRFADVLQRLLPALAPSRDEKASLTARLVSVSELGQPVWSPRDYAAFAREGYMRNAICYRSVRMIAEAAASIPLLLYERGYEVVDHPLLDLMRRPSPDHTQVDFLESWYGYLLVSGNAYVEAVALNGELRELHALRPDRMQVIPGIDGWPAAYQYTANGQSVTWEAEPVPGVRPILHIRLFHPVNDYYGMSPIEAAANAIDIHNAASGWNKALLDNAARPSGALVYGKGDSQLTGEQFKRLKAELEESFQGARNAGRPMLLEGGLDWKPLSMSPKDMDFIEARHAAAREIALAIGVPPMLLGIPGDNTYSNFQEASRALWRQTVLPLVNRTAQAFSAWLGPAFSPMSATGRAGGALELRPDLDQVVALASERDALWTRLEGATFLTTNEKRAEAGYDPVFGGDQLKFADVDGRAAKYSPDQPRVPSGNPGGGQWTNADGSQDAGDGGGIADFTLVIPSGPSAGNDPGSDPTPTPPIGGNDAPYGTTPDGTPVDPAQAAGGYPVDLLEEEARGGHTIRGHVGKTPEELKARVRATIQDGAYAEEQRHSIRSGSFPSLEAAGKLVNATLFDNRAAVARVAAGEPREDPLITEFGSKTGIEAYASSVYAQPHLRDATAVGVYIRPDRSSPTGFTVISAYPRNID